jgi:hypothetical protein
MVVVNRARLSISNEHCQIGQCRAEGSSLYRIVYEQTKIREVEPRANRTTDERVMTQWPRCLPNPGSDCANRCVCAAADRGQPVAQDG